MAALYIIDSCIGDLQVLDFGEDHLPDEEEAEDSVVYEWFPKRHRGVYDEDFFRTTLVTAVKVANDFANPDGGPAACTADEIIRHAAGVIAGDLCEEAGLSRPWLDPDECLLDCWIGQQQLWPGRSERSESPAAGTDARCTLARPEGLAAQLSVIKSVPGSAGERDSRASGQHVALAKATIFGVPMSRRRAIRRRAPRLAGIAPEPSLDALQLCPY